MSLDVYLTDESGAPLYVKNIAHSLGGMAREAGLYRCLWHPEKHGIEHAGQLIEPLAAGLALLASGRARFERFGSPNGWGTWENFVGFCADYLTACRDHPRALVRACR